MNKQVRLASRPDGLPNDSNWAFEEGPVPKPREGEVLVKISHISLDPAMRAWMNEGATYIDDVKVGDVMRANTVGEVIESNSPKLRVGDAVQGVLGVQQYAVAKPKELLKVDPSLAPIQSYLGVLGWPGMTAYFGLLDIGQPKEGETVLVSAAAGAVGSVVGQIAKIKGCRVVGLAGTDDKCAWLKELGFDATVNYKTAEDLRKAIYKACPNGVDVYFDNVGGEILDIALGLLNQGARIPLCGAISQYNATEPVPGPYNYLSLLVNRAKLEGFIVFDFLHRYPEALQQLGQWVSEGKLEGRYDIVQGLENAPKALLKLFNGSNTGKLIVQIGDEPA